MQHTDDYEINPSVAKRTLNVALKTALFASGKRQFEIARKARIEPQRLSRVIYGDSVLTDEEIVTLARLKAKATGTKLPEAFAG